jgi:hypothetical protein
MKNRSLGFKIGIVLAGIHLCLAVLAFVAMVNSRSSTSSLVFIWFFFLDAPLLLLVPASALKIFGVSAPLIQFGIFGSALWFIIPWLTDTIIRSIFRAASNRTRIIIIIGFIPLVLAGFFRLSFFSTKLLVQQERPEELKQKLNQASSDFLTGKVIFEDYAPAGVTSINRLKCRSSDGEELVLALPQSIAFLDDSYQVQHKLNLVDRKAFKEIEPLAVTGTPSCEYLGYMYPEGVYLYGPDGKEIWKFISQNSGTGTIDGVRSGDIDGDGKPEYAVYYRYREGIALLDSSGKIKWKYPVYALGHLEIADIRGDGKAEIIFDNSNNANGVTEFTVLDSRGAVSRQLNIKTASSEFGLISWPGSDSKLNILLTEEGKISIVDFKGATLMQLDAPGCRTFGELKALKVKLKKDEPAYLAVRKSLHPDLSVLYVYAADGKLVYQKTEVNNGLLAPALAVIPSIDGAERLLVGESAPNFKARIIEYSLTR